MPVETTAAALPFDSLAALRGEHLGLMRLAKAAEPPAQVAERVHEFLRRAGATGARIDGVAEREAAQSILDYWVGALFSLPHPGQPLAGPVFLAPFDATQAPDLADKPCPYMRLAAFGEADADRFFGREAAVMALADQVARTPLVLVAGPSGSGKSSLVLAGLLPRVRAAGDRAVLPVVVPGSDPLAALLYAVRPPGIDVRPWAEAEAPALARDPSGFAAHVAAAAGGRPALLVIDQFEELFTLCADQAVREAFAGAVAAVAQGPGGHRVVVTVRQDYLTQTLGLAALKSLAADPEVQFSPPPMSARELRRVIERPAERVGLKFEDGVVDELVKDVVGEPTALPLLQFTLARLWDARERNRITWEAYRAVGRPREALKRTADDVYQRLPQDLDRQVARLAFLELVRPEVGVEVVRQRVRREVLRKLASSVTVDGVLERFVAAGLIRRTPGADADDDRFEVAHEALTRNWPLLAGWLDETRRESATRIQLESTARLWLGSGRQRGYLLSGAALADAMRYRDTSPPVRDLIDASAAAQRLWYRTAVSAAGALALLFAILAAGAAVGWVKQSTAAGELQANEDKLRSSNDELKGANDQLGRDQAALNRAHASTLRQLRLRVIAELVRALAEAGVASPTGADQQLAAARLEALVNSFKEDRDMVEYLKDKGIDPNAVAAAAHARGSQDALAQKALSLGRSMRVEAFRDKDAPVLRELTGMRSVSYHMARTCADRIAAALPQSYAQASPYVREFWVLYWGEMALVEGTDVQGAMVAFGDKLKEINEHLRGKLTDADKQKS